MPSGHRRDEITHLPDPDEIKAACAEIRSGWTEYEEERRRVTRNPEARIPGADREKILELGEIAASQRTMRAKHGTAKNWRQINAAKRQQMIDEDEC